MCENLLPPDPVAVVMAIEEKFGITIPDEEVGKIRTMGQLYDYVCARVVRGQAQICVTSAAFYRLRRALMETCGVPRECVRTHSRLEDLVPLHDRWRYWQALRARLSNLHRPRLRRPAWVVKRIRAAFLLPLAPAVLGAMILVAVFGPGPADRPGPAVIGAFAFLACGLVGMFLAYWAACRRTERYAIHIPPACTTVRDMVYALVSAHPAAPIASDTARASDKEIWGTLCAIVAGELDLQPDSFTRDTTFT